MQYPVTATQWHPEKNTFEWATHLHLPHSFEAVSNSTRASTNGSPCQQDPTCPSVDGLHTNINAANFAAIMCAMYTVRPL